MNFIPADIIGSVAATLTTVCFIPQAWKVIKTRNTKDLSLWMYILFTCGVACWLVYGVMIGRPPMIVANAVTLVLAAAILGLKIRHG